jgi:hypothetical protein
MIVMGAADVQRIVPRLGATQSERGDGEDRRGRQSD